MNLSINHWANKFAGIITLFSLASALCVSAATTATITVATTGGGTVTPTFSGPQTVGNQYTLTAKPKAGFVFNGWTGSYVSSQAKLNFVLSSDVALTANFLDTKPPTLSIWPVIKSWSTNSVSNAVYVVTGQAKDNGTITQVYCKVNNGSWQPASTGNAWSNWWCNVTLTPNTNTVYAYAVDSDLNISKTVALKIIYSAAQPNLHYPIQATMVVVDEEDTVTEEATFAEKTFSDITGVGTYTYKKTGPVTGKLMMKYAAPPSAVNTTNNVNLTMLYNLYYTGTFAEDQSQTFYLFKTYSWAPLTLAGATLTFSDNNGSDQSVLTFPNPPQVAASGTYGANNPLFIPLASSYPGQLGDRVEVTFNHRKLNPKGVWLPDGTRIYTGTVVDVNTNVVKVLFDPSPTPFANPERFALASGPLKILSYHYNSFVDGNLVTNGAGTFSYTNYTWVGSLLQLNQAGLNKYVILTFTNDTAAGIYYDETHLPNSTMTTTSGSFELALPPQIIVQPQDYAVTNNTAGFIVVAAGTPVLTYQWQFNGANLTDGLTGTGSTISGSTTTNLTITGLSLSDFGIYRVVVSNDFGIVTSSNAVLAAAVPPFITSQPQSFTTTSGNTASFSVAASGSQPLGYRWQFNGANLPNGTTPWNSLVTGAATYNLAISSVATNDSGFYQVIITNSFGSVTSSVANLNVTP